MKNLPANIILSKNQLAAKAAWLIFIEITLTDNTVLRFVRNNKNVTYPIIDGHEYLASPFEIEPTKQTSKGEIPTVSLKVSNVTRLIQPQMQALQGGVGSTVKLTVVNSELLAENYSELEMFFDILAAYSTAEWIVFTLGAPNPLRLRFPLHRYLALHCRWRFETEECGYARKSMADIILSGTNPVSVQINNHNWDTGDSIRLDDVLGITPTLDNEYVITKTNANNFTLNGTNSSQFSGSFTSGTAGLSACRRILADCRYRENSVRSGGFPGMRSGGVRMA